MYSSEAAICGQLHALIAEIVTPQVYALTDGSCAIGRAPGCDIVVKHPLVSRLHAQIERSGPRYLLIDAGSINGTFVNGQRLVAPHLLKHDDVIGLGGGRPLLGFTDPDPTQLAPGQLRYEERTMRFFLGEQAVELTPTQFRLLRFLYERAGEVCTRESCAEAIWGRAYEPGRDAGALDQQLTELRGRLRAANPQAAQNLIVNRRGLGFMLDLSVEGEL